MGAGKALRLDERETLQDIRAYDEAKRAIAEGEELIPSEVTYALLDGANPVRICLAGASRADAGTARRGRRDQRALSFTD